MNRTPTHHLTTVALLTAFLCAIAPISLPLGHIPFTLGSLMVYVCALAGGARHGTAAVSIYLLLGAVGLPIFAGFQGGISTFLTPTGGFLAGYIPCALFIGIVSQRCSHSLPRIAVALAGGTLLLYVCGTAWFMYITKTAFLPALVACILPFIPIDIVKIAVALSLHRPIQHILRYV